MMAVKLNVGGLIYLTTMDTLLSVKDNYFTSLFSGRFQTTQIEDAYFIDRDGIVFRYILDYPRNLSNYQCPTHLDLLIQLEREAGYFLLSGLKDLLNKEIKRQQDKEIKRQQDKKTKDYHRAILKVVHGCVERHTTLYTTEQLAIPEMHFDDEKSTVGQFKSVYRYHVKHRKGPEENVPLFLITNGYAITGRAMGECVTIIDFKKTVRNK